MVISGSSASNGRVKAIELLESGSQSAANIYLAFNDYPLWSREIEVEAPGPPGEDIVYIVEFTYYTLAKQTYPHYYA